MAEEAMGLRERTRRAVRAEIVAVATELFTRDGFEATTVDDIAAAASISRSSFFRLFPTKEDVVLQLIVDAGAQVAAAVEGRPADEAPWTTLRRAFDGMVGEVEAHPDRARESARLLRASPSLHAAHLQRCADWSALIEERVAPRLGDGTGGDPGLRAAALTGAALACLEATNRAWTAEGCTRGFGELLDEAMGTVAPLQG